MNRAAEGSTSIRRPAAGIILPEKRPRSEFKNILYAFQHVLAMFGATVLGPLLMGFDPNTAVFFSGLATLFFSAVLYRKIPSYLGSSFSFIAAVNLATGFAGKPGTANPNIAIALSGIVAAGAVYFVIGLIVSRIGYRWLERLMPPVVTGAIVGVIGLNLAPVAVSEISGSTFSILFGLLTIALVVGIAVLFAPGQAEEETDEEMGAENRNVFLEFRAFLGKIPILLGGTIAYGLYMWATEVEHWGPAISFDRFNQAPWLGIPSFNLPHFDERSVLLIAPVAIVLVAENFGHIRAIATMTGKNLDPYLGRAFMADGFATMVSGFFGGTGVTTYAENMGVMSLTKNFSTYTLFFAGIIAVFLGLSPKFGELIRTIPLPIIGGLAFILFGLITATAGRIWMEGTKHQDEDLRVDFSKTRDLLVAGVTLVVGAGNLTLQIAIPHTDILIALSGIAMATAMALVLYHVIARSPARGVKVAPIMKG